MVATKSAHVTREKLEELDYVFQSGDYRGRSVLSLLLGGYYLEMRQMLRKLGKAKKSSHAQHIALDFWLPKINKFKPIKVCPICHKRTVHFFLLKQNGRNGFYEPNYEKFCCDNKSCITRMHYGEGCPGVGRRVVDWTVQGKSLYDLRSNFNIPQPFLKPEWVTNLLRIAYELPDVLFDESTSKEVKNQAAFAYMIKRLI